MVLSMDRLSDDLKVFVFNQMMESHQTLDAFFSSTHSVALFVDFIFDRNGALPDRFINCIKAVRCCTGLGIKEGKQLVDQCKETTKPRVDVQSLIDALVEFRDLDRHWIEVFEANDQVAGATRSESRVNTHKLKCLVIDLIVDIPF